MKKIIAITTLLLGFTTEVSAQYYQWQCTWQTYCGYYGCYRREQCCHWVTDYWGNTVWQCVWR